MKQQLKQRIDKEIEFMIKEIGGRSKDESIYRKVVAMFTKQKIHQIIDQTL